MSEDQFMDKLILIDNLQKKKKKKQFTDWFKKLNGTRKHSNQTQLRILTSSPFGPTYREIQS